MADDPDASRLLADFDRQIHRLAQQQQSGMQITAAQQSQLEALQTKIISHIKIKALNMAQVEYVDLRRKIGALLDGAVQEKPAAGGGAAAAGTASGPKITM